MSAPLPPGVHRALVPLALALLALLAYADAFDLGFTYDDHRVIEANELVTRPDLHPLREVFGSPYWGTSAPATANRAYRPLVIASFRADRALFGPSPAGPHAVNVGLHVAAVLLVWALARRLLAGRAGEALVPALAAALFAVHPLHVEAVASLVGRGELLAALAVLGAACAVVDATRVAPGLRAPGSGAPGSGAPGSRVRVAGLAVLASGLYAAGLLAKESAAVAPVFAMVAAVYAAHGRDGGRATLGRAARVVAPMALVLAGFLAIRGRVVGEFVPRSHVQLLDNPLLGHGAGVRLATALALQARYVGLLLAPWRLSADYGYAAIPLVRSPFDGAFLAGVALLGGALWALRRGGVPAVAVALYLVAFAPTANALFPIHALFAERLAYLPSVGACLLAAWALAAGVRRGGAGRAAAWGAVAVVAVFAARTLARNRAWVDDASLFLAAREVTPGSARVRNNAGAALLEAGHPAAARDEFAAAVRIYPAYGDAWINLGVVDLHLGSDRAALAALERAAALSPGHPMLAAPLAEARRRSETAGGATGPPSGSGSR